jgi:hypothetical protein
MNTNEVSNRFEQAIEILGNEVFHKVDYSTYSLYFEVLHDIPELVDALEAAEHRIAVLEYALKNYCVCDTCKYSGNSYRDCPCNNCKYLHLDYDHEDCFVFDVEHFEKIYLEKDI